MTIVPGKRGDEESWEQEQRHRLDAKPARRAVGLRRYRVHSRIPIR